MQAEFLDSHPQIGVVGTAATMPSTGANEGYRRYTEWVNGLTHWRQIRRAQFIESPLIHPTVMFRREVMERCGGYREGPFPEDYESWQRWFAQGVRVTALPQRFLTSSDPPGRVSCTPHRSRRILWRRWDPGASAGRLPHFSRAGDIATNGIGSPPADEGGFAETGNDSGKHG